MARSLRSMSDDSERFGAETRRKEPILSQRDSAGRPLYPSEDRRFRGSCFSISVFVEAGFVPAIP